MFCHCHAANRDLPTILLNGIVVYKGLRISDKPVIGLNCVRPPYILRLFLLLSIFGRNIIEIKLPTKQRKNKIKINTEYYNRIECVPSDNGLSLFETHLCHSK